MNGKPVQTGLNSFPFAGCTTCGWQYGADVIAAWDRGEIESVDTNPTHLCFPDPGMGFCPACGDRIDYCQGHGPLGDREGWLTMHRHDNGDHSRCHDRCEVRTQLAREQSKARHPAGRNRK